jgi:hypothetical protein
MPLTPQLRPFGDFNLTRATGRRYTDPSRASVKPV